MGDQELCIIFQAFQLYGSGWGLSGAIVAIVAGHMLQLIEAASLRNVTDAKRDSHFSRFSVAPTRMMMRTLTRTHCMGTDLAHDTPLALAL